MNKKMNTAALCGLLVICAGAVRAQTFIWTGAAGTDWHVAANWNPASVPGADADVVIGAGSVLLTLAAPAAVTLVGNGANPMPVFHPAKPHTLERTAAHQLAAGIPSRER